MTVNLTGDQQYMLDLLRDNLQDDSIRIHVEESFPGIPGHKGPQVVVTREEKSFALCDLSDLPQVTGSDDLGSNVHHILNWIQQ